jgi:hypothetical protein
MKASKHIITSTGLPSDYKLLMSVLSMLTSGRGLRILQPKHLNQSTMLDSSKGFTLKEEEEE